MNSVLVTGATGFIGRYVVEILKRSGCDVLAVARFPKDLDGPALDLKNVSSVKAFMRHYRPESLLHLAWNVEEGYWDSVENAEWVTISLELLKAFVENGGKRAVFAGSCAEYDWKYGFLSEDLTPLEPTSFYGISKVALYKLASAYAEKMGSSFAWGRVFFLFGEGEKKGRLVPSIVEALIRGEKPVLRQPSVCRDYMYVKDAAAAFVRLLQSPLERAVNIATGEAITPIDVARRVCRIMDVDESRLILSSEDEENEFPLLVGDVKRLRRLGFSSATGLAEGLRRTVDFWKGRADK